jgi:hypothetical protein
MNTNSPNPILSLRKRLHTDSNTSKIAFFIKHLPFNVIMVLPMLALWFFTLVNKRVETARRLTNFL